MSYVWPIRGKITQGFGRPALKVEPTMYLARDAEGWTKCRPAAFPGGTLYQDVHPGIDVACPVGTPILAPDDGHVAAVITYRIFNPFVGKYVYGTYGMFRFNGGKTILHVDHLSRCKAKGTLVAKGKVWAWTGESGVVTGPHAHEEIRTGPATQDAQQSWNWFRQNPERYLR